MAQCRNQRHPFSQKRLPSIKLLILLLCGQSFALSDSFSVLIKWCYEVEIEDRERCWLCRLAGVDLISLSPPLTAAFHKFFRELAVEIQQRCV